MTPGAVDEAALDLIDLHGAVRGRITIAPVGDRQSSIPRLLDTRQLGIATAGAAPVQLLEDDEYQFEINLQPASSIVTADPEVVISASRDAMSGRIRPGRYLGTLHLEFSLHDGAVVWTEVEVRSRKLDYETEYRAMLGAIAERTTELIESISSPSEFRRLQPETAGTSQTTYQRFVFLRGLLDSAEVRAALAQIRSSPHLIFSPQELDIDPSRGVKPSASLHRQLSRSGPRQTAPTEVVGMSTVPRRISVDVREPDLDTVPNRFVKWVLSRWESLVRDVHDHLARQGGSPRQVRELAEMAAALASANEIPAIRAAGRLEYFPSDNQVLQNRAGYREILRAFILAEAAGQIDWDHTGGLFGAGQRDVAELYEYWTYLEIVDLVRSLDGFTSEIGDLVESVDDHFTLRLRRSRDVSIRSHGHRRHTPVTIEVWFNKSFGRRSGTDRTWSLTLRPDCSIKVSARGASTWVHFDAKYRVDLSTQSFEETQVPSGNNSVTAGTLEPDRDSDSVLRLAPTAGVVKMHAYHDAIRSSAGAYVLYPGDYTGPDSKPLRLNQFKEIVPGIGSFVMNPGTWGRPGDPARSDLRAFLYDIIDFLVADGTQFSRDRYWESRIHRGAAPAQRDPLEIDDLPPPADTTVLVGLVRDPANLRWIESTGWYNLRADPGRRGAVTPTSDLLHTDLVLLHWVVNGEHMTRLCRRRPGVRIATASELSAEGYARPGGATYICVAVDPEPIQSRSSTGWTMALSYSDEPVTVTMEAVTDGPQASSPDREEML